MYHLSSIVAVCAAQVLLLPVHLALLVAPVQAESVIDRVMQTGVLTAGTRADSIPFAFRQPDGEWVGYSIDLLDLIHIHLERQLNRPIELRLIEVNTADRISEVANEDVDIVCGSTSYTSSRARRVDFSIGFFRTGTQFLVKRENDLAEGRLRVGVIDNTTNAETVQDYLRIAQFISVNDRAAGLVALESNRIDALASDGILLEGLRHTATNPDTYEVIPPEPIQPEVYSCILPKNNPEFLTLVNQTLRSFMRGTLAGDPHALAIFDRWFGPEGATPIDAEPLLEFFQQSIDSYQDMQPDTQPL